MAKKGKSSASERSRVEKELYKSIFNQFPDIVLIGNASHVIESMNRLAVDAFGDAEGKNCYEILRSVDTPCEDCFFVDGNESSFDFCLTSDRNLDDGSTLEIREMRVSSDPQKWIAVCRKIERFPLKDVSLLELSTAVDMMGDGVSITDLEGRIIYCNSSQERMHGFSKNELIGKKIDIFLPDNLSEGEIRQLFEDIAGGAVERIVMNKHKDGRQFWAWLKTAPMRDKDGRHVGYIGISRDVNEMIGSKLQLQGQVTNLEEKLEKEISHLSKHFDQMKILQELGRRMVSSTSEQEIANHAIAVLSETLGYSAAALVLVTISGHGRSYQILSQSTKFPPSEYGRVVDENIVNKSIDSRSPLIQRYSHESPTLGVIARSELVVPLISRDEVLGALVVADPDESMFTQDDVSLAVTIADLVAISLSNSMSSKQLQNRTMALNVLDEVTLQAISTLDVSGILSETAQRINKILDTQSCMIGMTSSDGQADWMAVEGAGEITEQLKSNKKYNEFFSKIIREGTVFYSNDYSSYQAKLIGENADIKIDSILASPIRLKDQTIGVIVLVNKASPVAFSIQDAELVRNFSDHLAVLIHNAETMASLDYSLRTRNSLLRTTFDLQVASGVSDIYQKVSDMLLEVVPYDAARFYSIREDGIKAVLSRNLGEKVELSLMENYVLDIVIKSLSELRGCQGTNSMTKTSNGEELRASILAIPLIGREDAIGSIVIARAAEKGFSEQDIEIATLFANHAAITLENASLLGKEKDLLAESLGRVKQLESILQLTTSVMSMGTREENPVDNVLSRMSSVLGFSKGLVLNLIEESDELGCSNGIGFEKNEILNLREVRVSINDFTRIIERFGKKFGERIAILGADLPIDPMTDELNLQLLKKIESELAMPSEGEKVFFAMLDTEGDPTGMIILAGGKGEIEKSKDLMGLLEIYGNLASIAINNQRLLDGEIHARSEIEALNDLMTHDINNFTQGVLGYLEMLSLDDESSEQIIAYAQKAMDQVENTKRLIENVRKLATIRSNTATLRKKDLGEVIEKALESIRTIFPKKIVKFNSSVSSGEFFVPGDEMIHEIFSNLFSNAIKFTPSEEVRIDLNLSSQTEFNKEYLRIEIIDYGRGIPDDKKQVVLERFGRLERDESRPYGFGIGLTIVKNLVKKYGGRIWVENRVPGNYRMGSKFVVLLPKISGKSLPKRKDESDKSNRKKIIRKVKEKTQSTGSSFRRAIRQPPQGQNEDVKVS